MDQGVFLLVLVVAAVAFVVLFKTAIVVPQQSAFIVERLGKYSKHAATPASTFSCRSSSASLTATA